MARWQLVVFILCASVGWCQTEASRATPLAGSRLNSETDKQIQSFQLHVKSAPRDYAGYDALGSAFFQKARETGDIAYYDLAEQTLKKSLELAPHDFHAADPLVHIALVYMGEHRFKDALGSAQQAIGLGSGDLAAFAIEGDAYTDIGDYDEAAEAYNTVQTLGQVTSSPLALACMSDSRIAYLRFLHGHSEEAIRLMRSAIAATLQINMPRENLAWLYFELGERYFQAGELENAVQSAIILSDEDVIKPQHLPQNLRLIPLTIVRWLVWRRCARRRVRSTNRFTFTSGRLPLFRFRFMSRSWAMFTGRWERKKKRSSNMTWWNTSDTSAN